MPFRSLVVAAAAVAVLASFASRAAAQERIQPPGPKIGVVDVGEAMKQYTRTAELEGKINEERDRLRRELGQPDVDPGKKAHFEERLRKLYQLVQAELAEDIAAAVRKYGEDNGFALILNRNAARGAVDPGLEQAILYANGVEPIDVTAGVVALLNAKRPWAADDRAIRVASVDCYGARDPAEIVKLAAACGVRAGIRADGGLEPARLEALRALREMKRFALAEVSAITYFDAGGRRRVHVTIDVVEMADQARRLGFAAAPEDWVELPDGLAGEYQAYMSRLFAAMQEGSVAEEERDGAFFHDDPALRRFEDGFVASIPTLTARLEACLAQDSRPQARRTAAWLLQYASDKPRVAKALAAAMRDPDSGVRNDATRALIPVLRRLVREGGELPPLEPILFLLDGPATTDRNKAAYALAALARDPRARASLEGARPVLERLAALEQPNNRDPAREILGALGTK